MRFVDIVDQVIFDRFGEGKRARAKGWVNFRQQWIWSLEEWTFRDATDDVSVASGSQIVGSLPADFLIARALFSSDGSPLEPVLDHRDFYAAYFNNTAPVTGTPEAFTVIGNSILVGPASSVNASDYKLVYERECTELVDDDDVPAIPLGFHLMLVHGGAAEGLKLQQDPTWESFEQDFSAAIDVMRQDYLLPIRGAPQQYGAATAVWG